MERNLVGKRPTFHRAKPKNNSYRIMLWLLLILGASWLLVYVNSGAVQPLLVPTPTPTRQALSFLMEAEAYFAAGKIDDPNTDQDAIGAYRLALLEDPDNALVWAELARIQTYSSALLSSRDNKIQRLQEALDAINQARELEPENSTVAAIRSFVLSWNSHYAPDEDAKERLLTEAMREAYRAVTLDPNNVLAQAFYAEVLLDHFRWSEAEKFASQAAAEDAPMDVYRVYGRVLESLGNYRGAIAQYERAAAINPNLTFLYIYIGVNYRHLGNTTGSATNNLDYEDALEFFARAAKINEQNGIEDPLPYIAIAKTYTQMGQFFIASRNAEKALSFNLTDPNSYGQLGMIYFMARNYESALPALKCAVTSCNAEENLVLERLSKENPQWGVHPVAVQGLTLESIEIAYYYARYGQVLALLSRPRENYCPEAYPVLATVRESRYSSDDVIAAMIGQSESICRRLDGAAEQ
jgi:tetratricopeptide (TPR) repeat protein